MPDATKIEYNKRIDFIIELILNGVNQRRFIIQNITDKYNIKESQIDKDIRVARDILAESMNLQRDDKISDLLSRYDFLYHKNLKIQDYRECRSILDSLSKLGGLAEPNKIEHSGGVNIPITSWNDSKE